LSRRLEESRPELLIAVVVDIDLVSDESESRHVPRESDRVQIRLIASSQPADAGSPREVVVRNCSGVADAAGPTGTTGTFPRILWMGIT
jgi:hypothetical protein